MLLHSWQALITSHLYSYIRVRSSLQMRAGARNEDTFQEGTSMGRKRVPSPKKLKGKLREIRTKLLSVTMDEMAEQLKKLGAEDSTHSGYVAEYESGRRQPSLLTLLAYSKMTGVSINIFVDDDLELPETLPCPQEYSEWIMKRVKISR